MYNMVVGQCYYKKNKEGKFEGYKGVSEFFSEYTLKVYNKLNELLRNCIIDKDLSKEDEFIVSEVILEFVSTVNELNSKENEYLSLEEFLGNKELYENLEKINFQFKSEIDPRFAVEEIQKIISLFQITVQKDISDFLYKEKKINLKFI